MTDSGTDARPRTTIRPAAVGDADAIARVHVASWRETYPGIVPQAILDGLSVAERTKLWHAVLSRPEAFGASAVFAAERDGAVIGFAAACDQRAPDLHERGFTGEISALYLLRSMQGLGLGRMLMARLARALLERGREAATLWVLRENVAARGFYERLGGELVGEKEDRRAEGVLVEVAYGWSALHRLVG